MNNKQNYNEMNLFEWHDLGFLGMDILWKEKSCTINLTDGEIIIRYSLFGLRFVDFSHKSPWGETDQIASARIESGSENVDCRLTIEMSSGDSIYFVFSHHNIQ